MTWRTFTFLSGIVFLLCLYEKKWRLRCFRTLTTGVGNEKIATNTTWYDTTCSLLLHGTYAFSWWFLSLLESNVQKSCFGKGCWSSHCSYLLNFTLKRVRWNGLYLDIAILCIDLSFACWHVRDPMACSGVSFGLEASRDKGWETCK